MLGLINSRISSDASHIRYFYQDESYFPKDIIKLEDNEVYVDCGAFDGDTIYLFLEKMKDFGKKYLKIFAIEPDENNMTNLKKNLYHKENILFINEGVYSRDGIISFNMCSTMGSKIDEKHSKTSINVRTLDNILSEENVTMIKMDLEGAELEALHGGAKIIKKCKPKLAIAVYHKIEDLYAITLYIKELYPKYNFYIRALNPDSVDVTLFAIP